MGNLPDDLQAGYERPFRQVVEAIRAHVAGSIG
jgi:hypothetical protein